jgi:hypothetical protein
VSTCAGRNNACFMYEVLHPSATCSLFSSPLASATALDRRTRSLKCSTLLRSCQGPGKRRSLRCVYGSLGPPERAEKSNALLPG